MITISQLPAVNATLNGLTAICLLFGLIFILTGKKKAHAATMFLALAISTVFLTCYLIYHAYHGVTKFTHGGWIRPIYFTILFTHTVLAVVCLPLILRTFYLSLNSRFTEHKRLAHWTWPVWMYVSVTGVLVYLILYQWFPPVPLH